MHGMLGILTWTWGIILSVDWVNYRLQVFADILLKQMIILLEQLNIS